MKAWRTEALGVISIVGASTRGAARYVTLLSARDAGYTCRFVDIKVCCAPEYDAAAMSLHGQCVDEKTAADKTSFCCASECSEGER